MAKAAYAMLLIGGASFLTLFALSAKAFDPDKKSQDRAAGEGEGEALAMSEAREGEQARSQI